MQGQCPNYFGAFYRPKMNSEFDCNKYSSFARPRNNDFRYVIVCVSAVLLLFNLCV